MMCNLKMEVLQSSGKLVSNHQTTWRNNTKNHDLCFSAMKTSNYIFVQNSFSCFATKHFPCFTLWTIDVTDYLAIYFSPWQHKRLSLLLLCLNKQECNSALRTLVSRLVSCIFVLLIFLHTTKLITLPPWQRGAKNDYSPLSLHNRHVEI